MPKNQNTIRVDKIFDEVTLDSAGGVASKESIEIDLSNLNLGYHSLAIVVNIAASNAAARLDVDFWVSPDGVNWLRSTDGYNITTDFHKAAGETDSVNMDIITFNPVLTPFIKFKATETDGTGDGITFSAWYIRQ